MIDLPNFAPLRIAQKKAPARLADFNAANHVLIVLPRSGRSTRVGTPLAAQVQRLRKQAARQPSHSITTRLDNTKSTTLTVALIDIKLSPFERLTWARKTIQAMTAEGRKLVISIEQLGADDYRQAAEALLIAASAAAFALPTFKTDKKRPSLRAVTVLQVQEEIDIASIHAESTANNIARWFAMMPPNELTALAYRDSAKQLAKLHALEFEFFSEARLKKLNAGAFLAVSQGNADRNAGIVRISHIPSKPTGRLALVGKGVLFDTGGNNIKSFKGMLDMHMDMQGSAVALGLIVALAKLDVPYRVDAWLAITENRVSATAYKSQDIVTASNGTTIQIIHTDAEGRMVLADALSIAAKAQPDLMIDFATLTGACITALTTTHSGVFTNRPSAHAQLIEAGRSSGERVWPFPMDSDFDSGLDSPVADIKQCTEDGSGDHILAARFLSRFVPKTIPWVHVDLSAAQHKGGLAHIPTQCTGFGVRFTLNLLEQQFELSNGFKDLNPP